MEIISAENISDYIGYNCPDTEWLLIDQEQINRFADCTLDQQFIHVDPERASETPFGSTIAHGFLTLSLLSHFSEQYGVVIDGLKMGINYGFEKIRFLAPVKVNSRVRAKAKIIDITENKPGQFRFVTEVSIEIEGSDTPALVAEWISLQLV